MVTGTVARGHGLRLSARHVLATREAAGLEAGPARDATRAPGSDDPRGRAGLGVTGHVLGRRPGVRIAPDNDEIITRTRTSLISGCLLTASPVVCSPLAAGHHRLVPPAAADTALPAQLESPPRLGAGMPLAAVSPVLGGGHRGQELVLQAIIDILHEQLRKGKRVSGQPVTFRAALLLNQK